MTDRSQGGSSLMDGSIELMVRELYHSTFSIKIIGQFLVASSNIS